MLNGLVGLPWWAYILVVLGLTHITIASVTIYLHRYQAHHALELHPLISHFFRFWLWLTTAMGTKEWVAVHRKHHAKVETEDDPHSPVVHGINKVLWEGVELYRGETKRQETLDRYGHETPDDWIERNLYSKFTFLGIGCLFFINFSLFGVLGISIWAIQMAWIPFFAAGVINGVGHWYGYRNFESADASTNIIPVGVFIGGEELHNNHHAFASSAKFSNKRWEFDLGWQYIRLLSAAGLAKVKKLAPTPQFNSENSLIDYDTVSAVISNRWHVMSDYAHEVVGDVYKDEMRKANVRGKKLLRRGKKLISRADTLLDSNARQRLERILAHSDTLNEVYKFKQSLQEIWQEKTATHESLVHNLQEWCRQAEETGIEALEEFSRNIRGYTLQQPIPV
tara:strand:+ start:360 stop:1544 length:1185 start_codon:yes stop_codon:yes gene_type:complete